MNTLKEIKLSYKNLNCEYHSSKISSSQSAFELLYNSWDKNEIEIFEAFKVIYLDNSNKVKGIVEHSKGGITGTFVDVRIIMAAALKSLSVAIILAHNHPSGSVKPSQSDRIITDKIKKAAGYFDIKVLDHIIITPKMDYYSFSDNGLLPN